MRRRRLVWLLTVAAAIAPACSGGGGASSSTIAPRTTVDPAAAVAAFCGAWVDARATADGDAMIAALEQAPTDIERPARNLARARPNDHDQALLDDTEEVFAYVRRECSDAAAATVVAPPAGAAPADLSLCTTVPIAPPSAPEPAHAVLYGPDTGDEYTGDMLGVVWLPVGIGDHRGNGERDRVTVRHVDGVVEELTVYPQVVLPGLGSVLSWDEDDLAVGLYGRGWDLVNDADQLVQLADALTPAAEGFEFASGAPRPGMREVHRGRLLSAPVVVRYEYVLQYVSDEGVITLTGVRATPDELATIRFLDPAITPQDGGRYLAGKAWDEEGAPEVVAWSASDQLAVIAVGSGVGRAELETLAAASRRLEPEEWDALVAADPEEGC